MAEFNPNAVWPLLAMNQREPLSTQIPAPGSEQEQALKQRQMVLMQPPPNAPKPPPTEQAPAVSKSMSYSFQSPPTDDELQMNELAKAQMRSRQEGIDQLNNQAQAARAKDFSGYEHKDYSNLAGLVDVLTGSNMQSKYKYVDEAKENQAMVMKLEEALRKEKNELTNDELQFLKDKAGLRNNKSMLEIAKADRQERSHNLRMEENIHKDLTKAGDAFRENDRQLGTLNSAVKSGDLGQIRSTLSNFARTIGGEKGALSDGDVGRAMITDFETRYEQMKLFLTGEGKASPEVIARMEELIKRGQEAANEAYKGRLRTQRASFSAAGGMYEPLMRPGAVGDNKFKAYESMLQTQPAGGTLMSQNAPPPTADNPLARFKAKKGIQ